MFLRIPLEYFCVYVYVNKFIFKIGILKLIFVVANTFKPLQVLCCCCLLVAIVPLHTISMYIKRQSVKAKIETKKTNKKIESLIKSHHCYPLSNVFPFFSFNTSIYKRTTHRNVTIPETNQTTNETNKQKTFTVQCKNQN